MLGGVPKKEKPKMVLEEDEVDEDLLAQQHQLAEAGLQVEEVEMDEQCDASEDGGLDPHVHSGWLFVHESDSEDEAEAMHTAEAKGKKEASTITRVRVCEQRKEFQELDKLGLVDRPVGCSIGIHPGNEMWRAFAPGCKNHGRSYSSTSGRTAKQALLRVVELMLQDHLQHNPKDRLAKSQLQRVREARQNEPKHKD